MKGMIKNIYSLWHNCIHRSCLLLAAACQNNAPAPKAETDLNTSAPQQAAEAEQPIQLVYWHTLTGMASSAQDELAEAFNASQNRIRVASEFQGSFYSEIGTKLLAAYGSGNAPEVSQLGTYEVGPFVEAGALVDLTPFIRSQDGLDIEDFPASILAAGEVDGGIYWLPFNIAVPLLYYNQEAFNEAGITSPPQTWDEFFEAARKLTKREENGNTTRYGWLIGIFHGLCCLQCGRRAVN
jgi:sn-glycerol 3-phosphate transport system substrate-binding protein